MKPAFQTSASHALCIRRPLRCILSSLMLLALIFLAGCSKDTKSSAEWNLSELSNQLLSEITYTDTLSEMDAGLMDYLYPDIDSADVSEQFIYISTGSTAEELAAFQAVDEDAAKRIEEGLQKRITMQTESFTDYVPEEVKRLEDAVLVRNGTYVVLSVSGDAKKAKEILGK